MRRLYSMLNHCRELYSQWVASGGFCADGMFMEAITVYVLANQVVHAKRVSKLIL